MTKKQKKDKPVKAWCWKDKDVGLLEHFILCTKDGVTEKAKRNGFVEGEAVRVEIREVKKGGN